MRDYRKMRAFVEELFKAGRDTLVQVSTNVKTRMSEEGKRRSPGEKVDWDSPRQQRFVMGKLRREGLPYQRTHRYRLGWKLDRQPFGATLSNRHPAGAIGGRPGGWQSRIHRNRWPNLLVVLFDELQKVPNELSNRLKVVSGRN